MNEHIIILWYICAPYRANMPHIFLKPSLRSGIRSIQSILWGAVQAGEDGHPLYGNRIYRKYRIYTIYTLNLSPPSWTWGAVYNL